MDRRTFLGVSGLCAAMALNSQQGNYNSDAPNNQNKLNGQEVTLTGKIEYEGHRSLLQRLFSKKFKKGYNIHGDGYILNLEDVLYDINGNILKTVEMRSDSLKPSMHGQTVQVSGTYFPDYVFYKELRNETVYGTDPNKVIFAKDIKPISKKH